MKNLFLILTLSTPLFASNQVHVIGCGMPSKSETVCLAQAKNTGNYYVQISFFNRYKNTVLVKEVKSHHDVQVGFRKNLKGTYLEGDTSIDQAAKNWESGLQLVLSSPNDVPMKGDLVNAVLSVERQGQWEKRNFKFEIK